MVALSLGGLRRKVEIAMTFVLCCSSTASLNGNVIGGGRRSSCRRAKAKGQGPLDYWPRHRVPDRPRGASGRPYSGFPAPGRGRRSYRDLVSSPSILRRALS